MNIQTCSVSSASKRPYIKTTWISLQCNPLPSHIQIEVTSVIPWHAHSSESQRHWDILRPAGHDGSQARPITDCMGPPTVTTHNVTSNWKHWVVTLDDSTHKTNKQSFKTAFIVYKTQAELTFSFVALPDSNQLNGDENTWHIVVSVKNDCQLTLIFKDQCCLHTLTFGIFHGKWPISYQCARRMINIRHTGVFY